MTIDYKALAKRVERLGNAYGHLADAAYLVEEVLGRWASATGGNPAEIRMAVSLLEGMAQEKPVGYVTANGLRMLKQEDATVLLYAHDYLIQPDCVALYMHPAPAAPQAEPRPCTCHPDDNPPAPCAQQYALNECRAAQPERQPVSEPTDAHPLTRKR